MVPFNNRGTFQKLSSATTIPKSMMHDAKTTETITCHSNSIKFSLTNNNKIMRMKSVVSLILSIKTSGNFSTSNKAENDFDALNNVIHIVDNSFCLKAENSSVYLTSNETTPHRTVKRKTFI